MYTNQKSTMYIKVYYNSKEMTKVLHFEQVWDKTTQQTEDPLF